MFEIKKQGNNGRKPLATLGNLKLACIELGIPDDKHTLRRASRAFDLYNSEKVEHVNDHTFNVKSQYTNRLPYQVWISPTGTSYCTCPDWMNYSGDMVLPDVHFHCKHAISARIWLHHNGNGSKIENEAKVKYQNGSRGAAEIEAKLNGDNGSDANNGTGDNPVHHQLDRSNPFEECELLDIEQIEGRSNGDLVHKLSNGEYIISYRGIMKLAEQHSITFEAARHDETHTVIAHARCGSNSRASGKPANGSSTTAVELAKRNAARQLLPLGEIKAMEHKAKLEGEFDWQVAKRKCLEIVPDFTFDILLNDLVKEGKLEQKHTSDYSRKEWLVIFDACKRDVETNGHDGDGGGDNTPSSEQQVSCAICSRTLTNPESVRLQVGPICREKIGIKGEAHLHGNIISEELLQASELYSDEALRKRIIKACLTLDAPLPVKVLNWLGNEYFGYRNRPILYYFCAAGQLNRIDTSNRKLRHIIVTRDTAETELDAHALAQMAVDSEPDAEVPITESEFVERCKELEAATVDDTTVDNSVDESVTAPMGEGTQMDGNGKRKLQMDSKLRTWLIEADGTKKDFSCREICEEFNGNIVMQLRAGIDSGGDISTVELDN